MNEKISVIIVAAGAGKRLGAEVPKAFISLAGKPLISYSLSVFSTHPNIDSIVAVVPKRLKELTKKIAEDCGAGKKLVIAEGGLERWNSVQNGVLATKKDTEWILVHDAARPFVTYHVINSLARTRKKYKCAVTANRVVDTIRTYSSDVCVSTIDRDSLIKVGTPQIFHKESLLKAFENVRNMPSPPTDEAMLMESTGISVGLAWGDPLNFKITTKEDLEMAEALIARRSM